jgi:hypothetical protein
MQLEPGSPEYEALEELLLRFDNPVECEDQINVGNYFDGVEQLNEVETLRKATLALVGRLPTQEEVEQVRDLGIDSLDPVLDAIFQEEAFFDAPHRDLQRRVPDRPLLQQHRRGRPAQRREVPVLLVRRHHRPGHPRPGRPRHQQGPRPRGHQPRPPRRPQRPLLQGDPDRRLRDAHALHGQELQREGQVQERERPVRDRRGQAARRPARRRPHLDRVAQPVPDHRDQPQPPPRADDLQAVPRDRRAQARRATDRPDLDQDRQPDPQQRQLRRLPRHRRPDRRHLPELPGRQQRLRPARGHRADDLVRRHAPARLRRAADARRPGQQLRAVARPADRRQRPLRPVRRQHRVEGPARPGPPDRAVRRQPARLPPGPRGVPGPGPRHPEHRRQVPRQRLQPQARVPRGHQDRLLPGQEHRRRARRGAAPARSPSLGTAQYLTPEQLERKIEAVTGYPWAGGPNDTPSCST